MGNKLLVTIPDRVSTLIKKGEITERYYNPGNLFEEVHLFLINSDRPNTSALQKTVGGAKLFVHNFPPPSPWTTLGWQSPFLRNWVAEATQAARFISPRLFRSYGNFLSGYLGSQMAQKLDIPFVVSLHTHPDDNRRKMSWLAGGIKRLQLEIVKKFERTTLAQADRTIIVYEPQRGYAEKTGAKDIRLIHNFVNPSQIGPKLNYKLHSPAQILCVGRQFRRKNPENIIRSIRGLPIKLTMIGDGPIHAKLVELAKDLKVQHQVEFVSSLPNDELCRRLLEYDIFVVHWNTLGIPKSVIEPLLAGLPVVVNNDRTERVPEVEGDWVYQVENSTNGYRNAIVRLLDSDRERETLGRRGRAYALANFDPGKIEEKLANLYNELLV